MSAPVKFIVNFVLVMAIQIFLLNDIVIKSALTVWGIPVFIPLLYPLAILILPVNTPHWLLMLLGFVTGITMDYFCNTPGMHAAACVLLAYVRPYILNLFFQQTAKELGGVVPSLFRMGITSFIIYVGFLILIHHLFFYLLQIWSFKQSWLILLKTVLSGITTILLIVISQLLFAQKDIRRL